MSARERSEAVLAAVGDRYRRAPVNGRKQTRDQYTLVLTEEPKPVANKAGEVVGVDLMVQLFHKGREVKIDPHRIIVNPPLKVTAEGDIDPEAALWSVLWQSVEETPHPRGWRTKGSITTVFAGAADDFIRSNSTTYATARTGGTLALGTTIFGATSSLYVGQEFNTPNYYCYESFINFDTSVIPEGDPVYGATLRMYRTTDQSVTDFVATAATRDWGAAVETTDYVSGASLGALTTRATLTSSEVPAGYNNFTDVAMASAPNLGTGIVSLIVYSDRHAAGTTPTGNEYLVFAAEGTFGGTGTDPKLIISHGEVNPESEPPRVVDLTVVRAVDGVHHLSWATENV